MINNIREDALNLINDRLCLDFANTVGWHASSKPIERLNTYLDLLTWSLERGLFGGHEANLLRQQANLHPDQAQNVLERAIGLREAIYRIFLASVNNKTARPDDLELLNGWLTVGMSQLKLGSDEKGFSWNWVGDENSLEQMLWWVALSTAQLLSSESLAQVGECADDRGCGWLFLDTSRNHSRRWCAMNDCGNRAKSRRHYEKVQDLKQEKAA
jgi:predicted RNA-binding Zn ribbon-like protein